MRNTQVLKFSKATQQIDLEATKNIHKKPYDKLNLRFKNYIILFIQSKMLKYPTGIKGWWI